MSQESRDEASDEDDELVIEVDGVAALAFKRLDQFLAEQTPYSRTFIKKLFTSGLIRGERSESISLKKMPPLGERILLTVPPPLPLELVAENIPLEILYEDEDILFVNKPAGLVTHPAPGHAQGTLVNALLFHCPDLKGIGGVKRPGIVHRLDKGTSGVMVVAKSAQANEELVIKFAQHDIRRVYEACVLASNFPAQGTLESMIGRHPTHRQKMCAHPRAGSGRHAKTYYHRLTQFAQFAHVEITLETGRTHQIRVHLSNLLNSPILCDPLYGNPSSHLQRLGPAFSFLAEYPHPLLHARTLGLAHPLSGRYLEFTVPAPPVFAQVLETARAQN